MGDGGHPGRPLLERQLARTVSDCKWCPTAAIGFPDRWKAAHRPWLEVGPRDDRSGISMKPEVPQAHFFGASCIAPCGGYELSRVLRYTATVVRHVDLAKRMKGCPRGIQWLHFVALIGKACDVGAFRCGGLGLSVSGTVHC